MKYRVQTTSKGYDNGHTYHSARAARNIEICPVTETDTTTAALVPDCVFLASADEYTRRTFAERHKEYNRRTADGCTADELRRNYDRESLTLHAILSAELFYLWEDDRAARCLESVRESYPDTTIHELRDIRDKYADAVGEIYG